ncbi:hypothetical protein ACQEVC_01655 [Plantactinospora sp. CA-294935]|uniref:hypothetical protein n=1 Tax=Plantactinospora sp. CA-294935 TaxID=3240012 RepID=UPI003D904415
MPDPVMVAVASALAAKAAEGLSDGGRAAFAALARLVRRKLRADEVESEGVLEVAQTRSDDETCVRRLAVALEAVAARDQKFADELNFLWRHVRDQQTAGISVINQVTGAVSGNVVQVRDVHGGISLGPLGPTGS